MAFASKAGSSASGIPAFTSSMCAPARTWAMASDSTLLKSSAFISSANNFLPVGLILSPMITKGSSKPILTSFVGELILVIVICDSSVDKN